MPDRKQEHIELALKSQIPLSEKDNRFIYEPLLSAHPKDPAAAVYFLEKYIRTPIWASSMTGGTPQSKIINENIARVCCDFGMGMGLGSCRIILDDNTHFDDYDVRQFIGDDLPLYANLGIAQVEKLVGSNSTDLIRRLIDKLKADGLIVHINPLQEWFQPEGNRIMQPPIDTIEKLLHLIDFPLVVKEVGQGMGEKSLERLFQLPLQAIEFGAFGGTNFSMVELLRDQTDKIEIYKPFAFVGQSAEEMVSVVNGLARTIPIKCKQVIISGGIRNYLDGFYLMKKCCLTSIYGQASAILKYASISYDALYEYIDSQIRGLMLAESYLQINQDYI